MEIEFWTRSLQLVKMQVDTLILTSKITRANIMEWGKIKNFKKNLQPPHPLSTSFVLLLAKSLRSWHHKLFLLWSSNCSHVLLMCFISSPLPPATTYGQGFSYPVVKITLWFHFLDSLAYSLLRAITELYDISTQFLLCK